MVVSPHMMFKWHNLLPNSLLKRNLKTSSSFGIRWVRKDWVVHSSKSVGSLSMGKGNLTSIFAIGSSPTSVSIIMEVIMSSGKAWPAIILTKSTQHYYKIKSATSASKHHFRSEVWQSRLTSLKFDQLRSSGRTLSSRRMLKVGKQKTSRNWSVELGTVSKLLT